MLRTLFLFLSVMAASASGNPTDVIADTVAYSPPPPRLVAEKALLDVQYVPTRTPSYPRMEVRSKSAYVIDPDSAFVFYQKNASMRLPIASLTKIMTATIILEEHSLDEIVRINFNPKRIEGKKMGLYANERISVYNLLLGLLITSGNDAAEALAYHNSKSIAKFAEKMNLKALALGLKDTHFSNVAGFDEKGNYSSAHDLATLTMYALKKPVFRKIVSIRSITVYSRSGLKHEIDTTNKLLDRTFLDIKGVKTGTTDEAGECFIGLINTPAGNEVLAVILDSPDRFLEAKGLLQFILKNNSI